jgi:hypothetical protein
MALTQQRTQLIDQSPNALRVTASAPTLLKPTRHASQFITNFGDAQACWDH